MARPPFFRVDPHHPQERIVNQPPYQPPPQAVVHRRGANHGLHIALTILTCGLWAITGWPVAAIMGRKTKTTVYPQQAPYSPQPGPYGPPPGQQPPHGPRGQQGP